MSSFDLSTVTALGVVTGQLPSALDRMQYAPETGGDVTTIDCVVPFMTVAQPDKQNPVAQMATTIFSFI